MKPPQTLVRILNVYYKTAVVDKCFSSAY